MRRLAIVTVLTASSLLFTQLAFGQCNFMPFDLAVRQGDAVWLWTVTDATVSAEGTGLTLTVSLDIVVKGHETSGQTVTNVPPTTGDNATPLELYQLALKDLGLPPASVQGMPPTGSAAWVWWVAAAFAAVALIGAAAILLVWRRNRKRAAYTYAVAVAFLVVGIMVAVLIPTTRTVGPFSKPPLNPRVVYNPIAPVYFNQHVAPRIAAALLGVGLAITVMAVGKRDHRGSLSDGPGASTT